MPAVAIFVLPLLARRRWRFAAPVSIWLLGVAISFVDGRLVVFSVGLFAAEMAGSFLLGNVPDDVHRRLGLAVVLGGAAIVVGNDPHRAPAEFFGPLAGAPGGVLGAAERTGRLAPGLALAILAAWTIALFATAAWRLRRRDLI